MDTQVKRDISQKELPISTSLTAKAMKELKDKVETSVICPKCGEQPKMTVAYNPWGVLERIIVRCSCGYIRNMEIYF